MGDQAGRSERDLVARLRSGDEAAFAALVDGLHGRLVAMASTFTSSRALAEDIAQETWMAVIRGLPGFEGRSSLRTWIFGILVKRARTMATRESRYVAAAPAPDAGGEPEVEWEPGAGRKGLWEKSPQAWAMDDPESLYQEREVLGVVRDAVDALPPAQRQVVLLRDVEGVSAVDACNILEIGETNQRVLLHRGRARIRRALDRYLNEGAGPAARNGAGAVSAPAAAPAVKRTGEPGGTGGGR